MAESACMCLFGLCNVLLMQELFRVGNAVPADVVLRNLLGDTLSPRAIAKSYARNYLPIEQK